VCITTIKGGTQLRVFESRALSRIFGSKKDKIIEGREKTVQRRAS
jgi:hypothetical protein